MICQEHPMLRTATDHIRSYAVRVALSALVLIGCFTAAFAQVEPPLSVPAGGPPNSPGDAITVGEWMLHPTIRTFPLYSDNLFLSAVNPISTWGFGIAPGLIAEWSNGIHKTTLYGNAELRDYPTQNELNAFDRQAGFVQRYDPFRDLNFSIQGDYTHQTVAASLISAIPTVASAPGTTTLPNGNTVLPNGNIVSPTGQIVGQINPALNVPNSTAVINPFDQFTGTASVQKILNEGILNLSGAVSHTQYQNTNVTNIQPDFTVKSLNGSGAFWVGPVLYVYSQGSFASYDYSDGSPGASAFRVVGGVGTRQVGLFQGSVYFGRQGTEIQDSGSAGGDVYGGRLTYFPTPVWKVSVAVDETINISSERAAVSNLAQTLSTPSPIVIPVGSSTKTAAASLQTNYQISMQWSAIGTFGYTRVDYLDMPRRDQAWLADAVLKYQMSRNLTLSWEYQYAAIASTAPLSSSRRNYFMADAAYKF
jgi:Putative beta-barrel porin 2